MIRVINRAGLRYFEMGEHYIFIASMFFWYAMEVFDMVKLPNHDDRRSLKKRFEESFETITKKVRFYCLIGLA